MHIHILGVAGTFMGGIAIIAKQLGHKITGMDNNIYPPMSTQLITYNIDFIDNYEVKNLPKADLYIIGNVLSRGNPCVEYILNNNLNYTSAANYLGENVLKHKHVLAVSGTHGKTTTSSILAWILEYNGLNPSFLIGGIANNLKTSARLTSSIFFVIEADEYDTAFFDKRSKFIHYYPDNLIIGNLEFDHADIFNSIKDIKKQFHNLIRTMPTKAQIIYPPNKAIHSLLKMGIYSRIKSFKLPQFFTNEKGVNFTIENTNFQLKLLGKHNVLNAISAIYAAYDSGVSFKNSAKALLDFNGVKKRLEIKYNNKNLIIYDDFAHHPTSVKATIAGLRKKIIHNKIIVVIEMRSNTMKSGIFDKKLINSLKSADEAYVFGHKLVAKNIYNCNTIDEIITKLIDKQGHIIFMSNGNFNNIIKKLIAKL